MMLVSDIAQTPKESIAPCVVAIGFFDGVHLGHHYLIEQVKEEAHSKGLRAALITFPVHPRKVMHAPYKPQLLTSYEEKLMLLEATGIDYCFALDFTPHIACMTAHDFMRTILKEHCNAHRLIIGYDHRFGHNRSEGFEDYCRFGQQIGIEVVQARAQQVGEVTISSSAIRRLLYAGDVSLAASYLGHHYFLNGTVVGGYKVGRTIGFPTANLHIDDPDKLIPADGVYAVRVTVDGSTHNGMLNIGCRPTINNGSDRSVEVHILHFNSDIYDHRMCISFVQRIRSEMKFAHKDELIAQLHKDAVEVEALLV